MPNGFSTESKEMPTNQFEANELIDAVAANRALVQARNAQGDAETYWDLRKSFPTSADLEDYITRLKPSQSSPHDQGVLAAYKRHEVRLSTEAANAKVKRERRTYGPDNPENSYVMDVVAKRVQSMGYALYIPQLRPHRSRRPSRPTRAGAHLRVHAALSRRPSRAPHHHRQLPAAPWHV